jgi:predicted phage terminase large subunit-like protein
MVGGQVTTEVPTLKRTIIRIAPQAGPQEAFLSTSADVAFYGGAAGGGKSFAILLDPLRFLNHKKVKGFTACIFRRTCPQITNPGGLWDESSGLYPQAGGKPSKGPLSWSWPKTRSWLKFSHMQYDADVHSWQGSQIAFIGFDELTHFSKKQFFYMLSRNRSACGVKPYIRATMNPDPDSWVREFIDWYIDKEGNPIKERSGVIRYFARNKDEIVWADTAEGLRMLGLRPKSFTFIAANVFDNAKLLDKDPEYLANLEALSLVERGRLLDGNWNIRPVAGMVFKRHWFPIVDAAPEGGRTVRYWDRAATEQTAQSPDPDWTAGVKMRKVNGKFYVLDVERLRGTPHQVQRCMRNTADQDGEEVEVIAEEDPGQAGKSEVATLATQFPDRIFGVNRVTKSKLIRAMPMSVQAEAGNVVLVRGKWNKAFLDELENFADWDQAESKPKPLPHDDQVDGASGAFYKLNLRTPGVH